MDRTRVSREWTKHLKDQDKENFLQALLHDTLVLGRLKEIITEHLTDVESKRNSQGSYDNPNWAYMQADAVGCIRTYKRILELLP
jgi:stalled ribosome alternative rescue factor ArfA